MESHSDKVADLKACNIIKKRLQHRCFHVNIAKSLRTSILKIICKRLLLPLEVFCIRNMLILAMTIFILYTQEDSIWLQFIYFLTRITFWSMKHLLRILWVVFIDQIRHYGKFTALHKLISIVLQLTNKIK